MVSQIGSQITMSAISWFGLNLCFVLSGDVLGRKSHVRDWIRQKITCHRLGSAENHMSAISLFGLNLCFVLSGDVSRQKIACQRLDSAENHMSETGFGRKSHVRDWIRHKIIGSTSYSAQTYGLTYFEGQPIISAYHCILSAMI